MPDGLIPINERPKFLKWWRAFHGITPWYFGIGQAMPRISYRTDDPAYRVWLSHGRPSAKEWLAQYEPAERGRAGEIVKWAKKAPDDETQTSEDVQIMLSFAGTPQAIEDVLTPLVGNGQMTREHAADLYDYYFKQLPEEMAKVPAEEEKRKTEVQRTADVLRARNALTGTVMGQQLFQELSRLYPMEKLAQNYIERGDEGYFNALEQAQQRFAAQQVAGQQQVEVALRPEKEELEIFEAPEVSAMAGAVVEKATRGMAPGTKLRSYIESQMEYEIPKIYESTRQARQDWIQRMRTPWPTEERERASLEKEIAKWTSVAQTAPATESLGTTYFGPGGLKSLAEKAAEYARERLAGIRPEEFTPRPEEEDPFTAALRRAFAKRKWVPEYYRQPGAGLVPRLTPAVRF